MGRAVILIVLGTSIIFTLTGTHMGIVTTEGTNLVSDNYKLFAARSVAKGGMDLCIMQLDSNRDWRTGYTNFSLLNGSLNARVTGIDVEHVQIQSAGTFMDRTVTVSCIVRIPPSDVPESFNYALASDGPLTLTGTVNVVVDDPTSNLNASIMSNNTINTGTQCRVQGFGYSHGSITCNPLADLPNVFVPHYNPGGLPPYNSNYPRQQVPDMNPDSYKSIATEVYEGDLVLNGNLNYGDYASPKIVWVGGDLKIAGGVDITGSVIFVVKGNITISGNVTATGVGPLSTQAFYSANTITINGNPTVVGQFYAKQNLNVNGNATIVGNAIVRNNQITVTTLNGTAEVRYRGANPLLTRPFWNTSPRPEIDSWWE